MSDISTNFERAADHCSNIAVCLLQVEDVYKRQIYIGAMIAAACMRNIGEYSGKFTIYMGEINDIGGISLSLFLGIAMITLKLWQLADLALPLITLLAGQTILMFLYTYIVVFNVMGRDYDAAVLSLSLIHI